MHVQGRCHCGQITYEAELDPDGIMICHCTDCQTLSGSAYRTLARTVVDGFKLLTGEPKIYVKIGDSGARRQQSFCGNCGSPIYATADEDGPRTYNVRAGTIDQRDELLPQRQMWYRSAQPWTQELTSFKRIEKA